MEYNGKHSAAGPIKNGDAAAHCVADAPVCLLKFWKESMDFSSEGAE